MSSLPSVSDLPAAAPVAPAAVPATLPGLAPAPEQYHTLAGCFTLMLMGVGACAALAVFVALFGNLT